MGCSLVSQSVVGPFHGELGKRLTFYLNTNNRFGRIMGVNPPYGMATRDSATRDTFQGNTSVPLRQDHSEVNREDQSTKQDIHESI